MHAKGYASWSEVQLSFSSFSPVERSQIHGTCILLSNGHQMLTRRIFICGHKLLCLLTSNLMILFHLHLAIIREESLGYVGRERMMKWFFAFVLQYAHAAPL